MIEGYEKLEIWQIAKDLAVEIYRLTEENAFHSDYALRDQMRRSAVSVPSNIAEGDERDTDKEAVRFFFISKGSVAEIRTQLSIAHEIGRIEDSKYQRLNENYKKLGYKIGKLIKARRGTAEE